MQARDMVTREIGDLDHSSGMEMVRNNWILGLLEVEPMGYVYVPGIYLTAYSTEKYGIAINRYRKDWKWNTFWREE